MLLSLRRRGQLLLVTSVLLGAVAGASLGVMVERAEAPSAVAAPARARGASGVAASQPGSRPAGSQAPSARSQVGDGSTGQPRSPLRRADRGAARKGGKRDRGTPADRGKDQPGKDK